MRRQKELVESLRRDGLSVVAALTTLKNLKALLRLRLESRDRVAAELSQRDQTRRGTCRFEAR